MHAICEGKTIYQTGIRASTFQTSTELDYNTPTCRITRELHKKIDKVLILEFKT